MSKVFLHPPTNLQKSFGEIKRNTKLDIPGLTELVKEFYKQTFYDKYKIGYIVCGSLHEMSPLGLFELL